MSKTYSAPKVSPLAPDRFPSLPAVRGARFSTASAGVKYAGRLDVMLVHIESGASIAGVFTRSATRAAPVLDCEAKLAALTTDAEGGFAILVNSGNANAFTGAAGDQAVDRLCQDVAQSLAIPAEHIFTASTGVIGEPLPQGRIAAVISQLADDLSESGAEAAAQAILTTDTFP
ncbi:MAG: bifunctional ornithine acetyltransferase/N-acetylglutamate synthase, partial [Pseudomonadota bacterium]